MTKKLEGAMASIYDDFDKRTEHERRFRETALGHGMPPYAAPPKRHWDALDHFESELQIGLVEDLLAVTPVKAK
jgi:hypothetical protein